VLVLAIALGLVALATAFAAGRARAQREARSIKTSAAAERDALVESARLEAAAARTAADREAREESIAARETAMSDLERSSAAALAREAAAASARAAVDAQLDALAQREEVLDADERDRRSRQDRAGGLNGDAERRKRELYKMLEQRAGTTGDAVVAQMATAWTETARAEAAAALRTVEQMNADPGTDREAKRVLEIASSRYRNHFLTERNQSTFRLEAPIFDTIMKDGGKLHAAIEEVANVKLLVTEAENTIRLDGLDSLGREVARRVFGKLAKKPESHADALAQPREFTQRIKEHLDGEVRTLGKKAFQVLDIARADAEIVWLVGALNWRTSYTQNQWLHAVEASFLAGMMAAELGLDEKLARRATLMHDIGKALTHKIEGSHAVIGADIARRVGEDEVIANAIGAHHADEPCNSAYAHIVAAADAMSGARPGARREMAEGFSARVEDLERIGASYKGVEFAHAVHGGRELRVYVRERDVDDVAVIEMSAEIAARIADELTFPGQIKVTVIRSFAAVATAS
jgi:ribonuclease Y